MTGDDASAGNNPNRIRAFSEVVSIDAWLDTAGDAPGLYRVCADVTFRVGALGAEAEWPVRFRLALKRAEIHVVIPEHEPLRVLPNSVDRVGRRATGTRTTTLESEQEAGASVEFGADAGGGPGSLLASFTGKAAAKMAKAAKRKTVEVREEEYVSFTIQHSFADAGSHLWEITAVDGKILLGKPFAGKEQRLAVKDTRSNLTGLEPGGVRLEARCRIEDLEITDIEIKDETTRKKTKQDQVNLKRVVIEQYIKVVLAKNGLEASNLDDKFGLLTLTAATASDPFE